MKEYLKFIGLVLGIVLLGIIGVALIIAVTAAPFILIIWAIGEYLIK